MSIAATITGPDDAVGNADEQPGTATVEQPRKVEPDNRPSGTIPTIDPFQLRDVGTDTPERPIGTDAPKRRGRPPGSRNKTTGAPAETPKVSGDLAKLDIESLLVSAHFMAAKYFEAPEWELEKDEAKEGAEYLQKISKHYNHNINPVALLWVGFIFWVITTYGTRGFATYARLSEKPSEKKGPVLVPTPEKNRNQPAPDPVKTDLSQLAPSQLWNEPPGGGGNE